MPATPAPKIPAWPPRSAPRLFVDSELSAGGLLSLDGNPAHYLAKVMRVSSGDAVILCDNISGEWAAKIVEAGKRSVTVEVAEQLRGLEQVPDFWLCPALLKKDRFDLVLEKATELGVREIRPFIARRCVADKLNPARATTIVTEAAEQCARTALPELREPVKLAAMLNDWPEDRTLFFADELGGQPAAEAFESAAPPRSRGPQADGSTPDAQDPRFRWEAKAGLLIGPEGGFDDAEREAIRAHPAARAIALGPRILRGETAAIAATALWMGVCGDWNK